MSFPSIRVIRCLTAGGSKRLATTFRMPVPATHLPPEDCCVLNQGRGAWAFEILARQLSDAFGVPVSPEPRRLNYLLNWELPLTASLGRTLFIPLPAIRIASDKRLMAAAFRRHGVPTPQTVLIEKFAEVVAWATENRNSEWCLKYPTGCGGNGHRMITAASAEPPRWPRPWIVQEFIRQERPEVYRLYAVAGELFGWVVRRFPERLPSSPWVAHARGARYECLGAAPRGAMAAVCAALAATGLHESFGCVDLMRRPSGEWVVLEVGTDGIFNHVDRELDNGGLEEELCMRLARAFRRRAGLLS